ncbi:hypothetical protein GBAR_LOCUS21698 [Geodia barretti]|uniref:Uncharacterized protein n=1 Tax=Geodia barretti TaxID=519541 RepID=A0AA35WZV0_GEOBA|nr:hypothetical protein GBAR_LOCUS21698 [Geodia barretti]
MTEEGSSVPHPPEETRPKTSGGMSSESKALRKSYDQFMKGADPSSLVAPLYSQDLLTDDEKARALLDTQTNRKRLDEIFDALTRRVGVEPKAFLLIMQTLKNVPALKPMGEKMQELYNEVVGEFGCDSSNEHAIGRVEPSHSDSNSLPQLTSKANHQTKLTTSTFPPEAFSVFGTSIRCVIKMCFDNYNNCTIFPKETVDIAWLRADHLLREITDAACQLLLEQQPDQEVQHQLRLQRSHFLYQAAVVKEVLHLLR